MNGAPTNGRQVVREIVKISPTEYGVSTTTLVRDAEIRARHYGMLADDSEFRNCNYTIDETAIMMLCEEKDKYPFEVVQMIVNVYKRKGKVN